MAIVTTESDVVESISRANELLPLVGVDSEFTDRPHPGTGNSVQGWIWDQRTWPSQLEQLAQESAPSIWDPGQNALDEEDFQSGVGGGDDSEVLGISEHLLGTRNPWFPVVNHGYYYERSVEGYFYSDSAQAVPVPATFDGTLQYVDLDFIPKPGIPVRATKFKWNSAEGKWEKFIELVKKASFTGERDINGVRLATRDVNGDIIEVNIDTTLQEFVVESELDPQRVFLNKSYATNHGGTAGAVLADMEQVGLATGADDEEFNLLYSPLIIGNESVKSFYTTAGPATTWTVVTTFTGIGNQCILDYDLGTVRFNASPAAHPPAGATIGVSYKSSVLVEYEPIFTPDSTEGNEVSVNPVGKTSASGFIYLKQALIEPYSILLEAEAPLLSLDFYGPAFIGTPTKLKATVKSKNGDDVEGAEVTFVTLNTVGEFSGGNTSVTSLTDFTGVARTNFNAPRNIRVLGAVSSDVTHNAGKTEIVINSTSLVGDPTQWYIYKVFNDDPLLGIADPRQYYIDYLSQEGITGPTAVVPVDPADYNLSWEHTHRVITGLLTPNKYDANLRNGKKQLVITWDSTAINPHNNPFDATLGTGAFIPMRPESAVVAGTETTIIVNSLLDLPAGTLAGYFIVGPTVASLEASVYNERLRTTITSNQIDLEVKVPQSMDGTVLVSALNELQKQALLGVGVLDAPLTGILPLGFRIKGLGVNLAACLDGLTYFDINQTLHDTSDGGNKTGKNVLGHAFTVR